MLQYVICGCIHCLTKLLLQPRNFSYCICMIGLESYHYATAATNSQCKSGFATRADMHHTLQNTQYGTCYGICFPSGSLVGSEDLATDSILYSSADMCRSPFLLTEQQKCLERRSQCLCIVRKYWSQTKTNMSNGTALNSNHWFGSVSSSPRHVPKCVNLCTAKFWIWLTGKVNAKDKSKYRLLPEPPERLGG